MSWRLTGWRGGVRMSEEGVRLLWPKDAAEAGEAALHLVATGRGLLKFVLGDEQQRYRLLAAHIRWGHVLLAMRGDAVLGFAAIKRHGCGPYMPGLRAFIQVFGPCSGCWRWGLFVLLEWRGWRSECYLYGLKVLPQARRQGIAAVLVETVLARAGAEGVRRVELDVSDRHAGARALYLKLGFRVLREVKLGWLARWLNFSTLCVMARDL